MLNTIILIKQIFCRVIIHVIHNFGRGENGITVDATWWSSSRYQVYTPSLDGLSLIVGTSASGVNNQKLVGIFRGNSSIPWNVYFYERSWESVQN